MKKLDYDYCQAAPVLEWMSQKWALVTMMKIDELCGSSSADGKYKGICARQEYSASSRLKPINLLEIYLNLIHGRHTESLLSI